MCCHSPASADAAAASAAEAASHCRLPISHFTRTAFRRFGVLPFCVRGERRELYTDCAARPSLKGSSLGCPSLQGSSLGCPSRGLVSGLSGLGRVDDFVRRGIECADGRHVCTGGAYVLHTGPYNYTVMTVYLIASSALVWPDNEHSAALARPLMLNGLSLSASSRHCGHGLNCWLIDNPAAFPAHGNAAGRSWGMTSFRLPSCFGVITIFLHKPAPAGGGVITVNGRRQIAFHQPLRMSANPSPDPPCSRPDSSRVPAAPWPIRRLSRPCVLWQVVGFALFDVGIANLSGWPYTPSGRIRVWSGVVIYFQRFHGSKRGGPRHCSCQTNRTVLQAYRIK